MSMASTEASLQLISYQDVPSAATCMHGKRLNRCTACSKYTCQILGCPSQGHRFAGAYVLMRHMRNCHSGEVRALTKRKELEVHHCLESEGIDFRYQHYLPFKTCGLEGTACCYVDFSIDMPWGTLLLEVDEDQHFTYPPECDVVRDLNIASSIALGSETKTVILRYNPDNFCVNNDVQRFPKRTKLAKLIYAIRAYEVDPAPGLPFARRFLYYDTTDGVLDISNSWPREVREISQVA